MKPCFRILSSLALAVISASLARAEAYAYSQGSISAILYLSLGSFGVSYGSGTTNYYSSYSTGNADYHSYFGGNDVWGSTTSFGPLGYASQEVSEGDIIGITNLGSYAATYVAQITSFSNATFSIDGFRNYAYADSEEYAYDSLGAIESISLAEGYTGNFVPGTAWSEGSYGSSGEYMSSGYYDGTYGSFSMSLQAEEIGEYFVTVQPGATDYLYLQSMTSQEVRTNSVGVSPGPVAIAPFAVGLLGTLRRRRRKDRSRT